MSKKKSKKNKGVGVSKEDIDKAKKKSRLYGGLKDISDGKKGSPAYQKFRSFDVFRESITIMLVNFIVISIGRKSGVLAVGYGMTLFVLLSSILFSSRHIKQIKEDKKKVLNTIFIIFHIIMVMYAVSRLF